MNQQYADETQTGGEVVSSSLLALAKLSPTFVAYGEQLFSDSGIDEPRLDEWYPSDVVADALTTIESHVGRATLVRMGREFAASASWPGDVLTVPDALARFDDLYRHTHRGSGCGRIRFDKVGEADGLVTCRTPYPAAFEEGLVLGVLQEFRAAGRFVRADPTGGADGADAPSTFDVSW